MNAVDEQLAKFQETRHTAQAECDAVAAKIAAKWKEGEMLVANSKELKANQTQQTVEAEKSKI